MCFADEETSLSTCPRGHRARFKPAVCNFKSVLFPWPHRSLPSTIKEQEQRSQDGQGATRAAGPCQRPQGVPSFLRDNVSGFPSPRCTWVQDLEGNRRGWSEGEPRFCLGAAPSKVWGKGRWFRRQATQRQVSPQRGFPWCSLKEFLRLALDHPPPPARLPKHVVDL